MQDGKAAVHAKWVLLDVNGASGSDGYHDLPAGIEQEEHIYMKPKSELLAKVKSVKNVPVVRAANGATSNADYLSQVGLALRG